MKSRSLVLVVLSTFCMALIADAQGPFLSVSLGQVDGYKKLIESEYTQAARIKKVLIGATVTVGAVLLYRWMTKDVLESAKPLINYGFGIVAPSAFSRERNLRNIQQGLDDLKKDVNLIVRHEAALNQFLQDKGYAVGAPLTWGQTVRSWGSWCGNLMAVSFFSTIVSASMSPLLKYFKAFDTAFDGRMNAWFPEKSMKWYLVHRISLPQTFAQLEQGAKKLTPAGLPDAEGRLQELVASWQIFIMQMERLLGFINYRTQELDPLCQRRADQIFQQIHDAIQQTSIKLNECQSSSKSECAALLDTMRVTLDQELHAFIEIEAII